MVLTPAINTSYFSSLPAGSNLGARRGRGGEKEGRTRRSREEVEYSVKTGILTDDGKDKKWGKKSNRKRAEVVNVLLQVYLIAKSYVDDCR